ncbi:restriction endonuclease [Candidatus Parcubacteria bacterium]|nr:restriction endonuclease [Candidatus Parcubacteria bacterium]
MNVWVKKSIELANSPGYLDKLHSVYPMDLSDLRVIPKDTQERISKALKEKDFEKLLQVLLNELELFPIKDSYVAFLRKNPEAVRNNPKTVNRLGERLIKMGITEILRASTQPKETNRKIGPLFQRWLSTLGYPLLSSNELLTHRGIALLKGSDKDLRDFVKKNLQVSLKKGIDLVAKVKDVYVIGEAKFLTDFGGHQNAQFSDPLGLIQSRKDKKVLRIGILDGVIWLRTQNKMHLSVIKKDRLAMSALLLKEFIEAI